MTRAYGGNVELRCPGFFHPLELVPQAVSEGTNTITPTDTKHTRVAAWRIAATPVCRTVHWSGSLFADGQIVSTGRIDLFRSNLSVTLAKLMSRPATRQRFKSPNQNPSISNPSISNGQIASKTRPIQILIHFEISELTIAWKTRLIEILIHFKGSNVFSTFLSNYASHYSFPLLESQMPRVTDARCNQL